MKLKTLRRLRAQASTYAPRVVRRREFDVSDAPAPEDADGSPEVVFDRTTGPFGTRTDEET